MRIAFTVEVNVERESGPFASKDDLAGQIEDALVAADPSQLDGDAGGVYTVDSWDVSRDHEAEKPTKRVSERLRDARRS